MNFRYFDDDEDTATSSALEYIPAPGSPSYEEHQKKNRKKESSDSDEDPLDAFMAGIDAELEKSKKTSSDDKKNDKQKGVRADIDNEDDEESYYR